MGTLLKIFKKKKTRLSVAARDRLSMNLRGTTRQPLAWMPAAHHTATGVVS
jgi:hypothetical protein